MTDLGKTQLNAILSALDGQPRNPNTKDAALRRIDAHAERYGLGLDDALRCALPSPSGSLAADRTVQKALAPVSKACARIPALLIFHDNSGTGRSTLP